MATFYVRSSHETAGTPAHFPYPGYQFEAEDAQDAANQYVATVGAPAGAKLVVTTLEGVFTPALTAAPAALPPYA